MAWLKNIFFTALLVVGATMATAVVVTVLSMLMAMNSSGQERSFGDMAAYAIPGAIVAAMMIGGFFSIASLMVAGVTMPIGLGLIRMFKLPRPLFDIFGGGAAGLICAAMMMGLIHSLEQAKGGNLSSEIQPMLDICAMLGGAALAYLRHAVLVTPKSAHEHPAPPVAFNAVAS